MAGSTSFTQISYERPLPLTTPYSIATVLPNPAQYLPAPYFALFFSTALANWTNIYWVSFFLFTSPPQNVNSKDNFIHCCVSHAWNSVRNVSQTLWDSITKCQRLGSLQTTKIYFSESWRLEGDLRTGCQNGWARPLSSLLYLYMSEGARENPNDELSTTQSPHLLIPFYWTLGLQHVNFDGTQTFSPKQQVRCSVQFSSVQSLSHV